MYRKLDYWVVYIASSTTSSLQLAMAELFHLKLELQSQSLNKISPVSLDIGQSLCCIWVSLKDKPNTSKTSPINVHLDGCPSDEKFIVHTPPLS